MAYDRVVDSSELDADLTAIANAIRSKTGKTDGLTLEQMPGEIEGIETGGSGFADGNFRFSEHVITVGEGNGVTNHRELVKYFASFVGGKSIIAYSLIGIADTYNQPIMGSGIEREDIENRICYRYRDGYISVPPALGNGAYDAALVVGTQYKVYCTERIE